MELSANRRYTSKLVLEDTTIVFQKTKGERTEKKYMPYWKRQEVGGSQRRKECYQDEPEIIVALADLRFHVTHPLPLTNVTQTHVQCFPQ